jgi:hypothetical protein
VKEGYMDRRRRGHTVARPNFFPLVIKARLLCTNANNPPVGPFAEDKREIEAEEISGTKALQLNVNPISLE